MAWVSEVRAYQLFSFLFVLVLAVAAIITLRRLPQSRIHHPASSAWRALFANTSLRWIFALFFVNAIPPSMTATLFLFFVSDILHMPAWSGAFLALYFLSAVLSMSGWAWASLRIGKRRTLMIAMGVAISSFVWAYRLGANDALPFVAICMLSGMALGGDLSILPSLLADAVSVQKTGGGLEFGIWNFISKFTLALAAGIGLPILYYLGYAPGGSSSAGFAALSFSYALLPCAFKCAALALLAISPISKPGSLR
jgi:Na+/melibiose symporter-like transporter